MKKIFFIFCGILGLGIAYWLISPLFITKTINESLADIGVVSQSATSTATTATIAQGSFAGLAAHSAGGTAQLLKVGEKYFVRFESDFTVTNGPDLFVGFGKDGVYNKAAVIGALKGNVGSQNYEVPASIDPTMHNEIWVWCRSFSVPFGKAVLHRTVRDTVASAAHTVEWKFTPKGEDEHGRPTTEVAAIIDGATPRVLGVMYGTCAPIEEPSDDPWEFQNKGVPINFVQCWWAGAGIQFGAYESNGVVEIFPRELGD